MSEPIFEVQGQRDGSLWIRARNAYDIRDQLKARGYRWDPAFREWELRLPPLPAPHDAPAMRQALEELGNLWADWTRESWDEALAGVIDQIEGDAKAAITAWREEALWLRQQPHPVMLQGRQLWRGAR